MNLKVSLQNIYNQLSSLLQKTKLSTINALPNYIDNTYLGENKIPQLLNKTIQEITVDDLKGITTIGSRAFSNCTNLISVTIPDSVISIDYLAFHYCTSLISVVIGTGIKTMGDRIFDGSNNLVDLYIKATVPPTIQYYSLNGLIDQTTIHVPIGSGEAYKNAENWSRYSDIIIEDIEL